MPKPVRKSIDDSKSNLKARSLGQPTKTAFFRQQLHEFLVIAAKIEETKSESLDWDLNLLGISNVAWNKIIHRGIKPIIAFAHPSIVKTIPGSLTYYRTLAMVDQDSMQWVRLKAARYELEKTLPDKETAAKIGRHLNQIISRMIELDDQIDVQEFDLWRGIAVGSEAQCFLQSNRK